MMSGVVLWNWMKLSRASHSRANKLSCLMPIGTREAAISPGGQARDGHAAGQARGVAKSGFRLPLF